MSLFGGETPLTTTDGSSDSDSLESHDNERLSPPFAVTAEAQNAQDQAIVIDSDDTDELYPVSDEEEESEEEEPFRPNRYRGQPQTWKGYTAADRQIAASLDQIQNSDLAAHLYNAHALKRRVRRPIEELETLKNWHNRDSWLKKGTALEYTDAAGLQQTDLVPSKDWTAWPLPPEIHLPRRESAVAQQAIGAPDEWSIGAGGIPDAGIELRDEMLAVFLRIAKENWNARETSDEEESSGRSAAIKRSMSRLKSVRSIKSQRSTSRGDTKMKNGDDEEGEENEGEVGSDAEDEASGRKRGRKVQDEVLTAPTLLADDARAYRLLQPSINSILSRFDELALAIQRTRLNHLGHGKSGETSTQSDYTSAAESSEPESKPSSRAISRRPTSRDSRSRPSSRNASPRQNGAAARAEETCQIYEHDIRR
ncbi:hypothetical protein NX059_005782 [Plenodomus lindquistii]|nr:hypothetical protein NX059_005782 [Plenodomus lindquistii]